MSNSIDLSLFYNYRLQYSVLIRGEFVRVCVWGGVWGVCWGCVGVGVGVCFKALDLSTSTVMLFANAKLYFHNYIIVQIVGNLLGFWRCKWFIKWSNYAHKIVQQIYLLKTSLSNSATAYVIYYWMTAFSLKMARYFNFAYGNRFVSCHYVFNQNTST